MSQFDFWQQWGAQLDDTQFANAWAALGVVWSRGLDSPRDALARRFDVPAGYRVPWRFPRMDLSADLLAGTNPSEWAAAWSAVAGAAGLRLAVGAFPDGEPVMPWLRLLSETSPLTSAVGLDLPGWPDRSIEFPATLRLGYLPGNLAEQAVAGLPCAGIDLGPRSSQCDVLVYVGTAAGFASDVQSTRGQATFALLFAPDGVDIGSERSALEHRLLRLSASGYAYSRSPLSGNGVRDALTRFLGELQQDKYFDEAISASLRRSDLFAAFTTPLAGHRLSQAFRHAQGGAMAPAPRDSGQKTRTAPAPAPEPPRPDPPARGGGMFSWLRRRGVSPPAPRETAAEPPFKKPPPLGPATRSVGHAPGPRVEPPRPRTPEATLEKTGSESKPAARHLQQKSFASHQGEMKEADNGFIAGQDARVQVRIGLPDENIDSLATPFPDKDLPQHLDEWTLDVWLTEPEHLPEPLLREITLQREGSSNWAEFDFRPMGASPTFEARISVLHRGRVIQTAVLRASVQPDAPVLKTGRKPKLEDHIHVRHAIGDLKNRRQFDLAFVLNHTESGKPRAVALAEKRAWIANLDEAKACAGNISKKLAQITQSAPDFAEGIRSPKGRALLVDLAREGVKLRRALVREQINAAGNQASIAKEEFVQVVSTRPDSVIPFEFIYDFDAPEADAPLCKKWDQGIRNGKLPDPCTKHSKDEVCPMGFWGLQKVIERHQVSPGLGDPGKPLYLQSEPSEARSEIQLSGISVFGASKRVTDDAIRSLAKKLKTVTGKDADRARDWDDWVKAVERSRPKLLIALAHSDGAGTNSGMEIGGKALADVMVTSSYILFDEGDPAPLVALLGCDTVGTTDIYSNYARTFRGEGAAIVIATIATVLAANAATVAESLVAGLLSKDAKAPTRVGEVLRAIKRQALLDKQIMPLCLVAYGDADWQIRRN